MDKTSRFKDISLEDIEENLDTIASSDVEQKDISELHEEANELNDSVDNYRDDADAIQETMESLEQLSYTIESFIEKGTVTKELCLMTNMQAAAILKPYGGSFKAPSLESLNDSPLEYLIASQESIGNTWKRYSQAMSIANKQGWEDFKILLTKNTSIAAKYAKLFSEHKTKLASHDKSKVIHMSYSGAGYFFGVRGKDFAPDFTADMDLSKYIVNTYSNKVISIIEKATQIISAADFSTEESTKKVSASIEKLGHPASAFDAKYLDKRYFGPTTLQAGSVNQLSKKLSVFSKNPNVSAISDIARMRPVQETNDQHILQKLGIANFDKIMESDLELSVNDVSKLISIGEEYIKLIIKANDMVKGQNDRMEKMWNEWIDKINTIGKDTGIVAVVSELSSLMNSYNKSFKYPLKQELNRMIKIVNRLHLVLKNTI